MRRRPVVHTQDGIRVDIDGKKFIAFCSNDYLGLAHHPTVIAAFRAGAEHYGVGAGASHLISGHSEAHHALELELAEFVGAPRALLFSTGYMANLGIVGALSQRHSAIFEDRLNHASLVDAARVHGAKVKRYAHANADALGAMLQAATAPSRLILSDGVFSMDGDLAPLPQLLRLADTYHAELVIDDAHGFGVLGEDGRGSLAHWGIAWRTPLIVMGTLGKAFGTFGAFVAGADDVIETLIQYARTYIYTTALPPALAQATRASLRLIRAEPWRRARLQEHIARFRTEAARLGLKLVDSPTPIQPLIFGDAARAVAASEHLQAHGIWVTAIRPPTVPQGSARLRVTFSSAHSDDDVAALLAALASMPDALKS